MTGLKRLFQKGKGRMVTVCWMDEEVTMVLWGRTPERSWKFDDALLLEARGFSAKTYRDGYEKLTGEQPGRRLPVKWIILKESMPGPVVTDNHCSRAPVRLPAWIERCWYGLSVEELPRQIVCGMTAVEQELVNWSGFSKPGTGLCLVVGSRFLFIGRGNQATFRRLSRRNLVRPGGAGRLLSDWLLQTRLLFRNRTGVELRRVYDPEGRGIPPAGSREPSFDMIAHKGPHAWNRPEKSVLGDGMIYVHQSAANFRKGPPGLLRFPQVHHRVQCRQWESRLRVAACLLLCGWGLLLLGACRHSPTTTRAGRTFLEEWGKAVRKLETYQSDWFERRGASGERELPFRFVGNMAQSIPEGVRLHRIHMARQGKGAGKHLQLAIEGTYDGKHPSGVFRNWMDQLRGNKTLSRVENLRFHREADRIVFSLQGRTTDQGMSP